VYHMYFSLLSWFVLIKGHRDGYVFELGTIVMRTI